MNTYLCSIFKSGTIDERVIKEIGANTPQEAARMFVASFEPQATVFPGRWEQPFERDDNLFEATSYGVSTLGRRVWVYRQIGFRGGLADATKFFSTEQAA